ncbi:MAG: hypothetical protein KAI47_04765 [Deltaproteobacteria bacterium]|nr:hypothetical protein [Deltaproteobacteria bacterium]
MVPGEERPGKERPGEERPGKEHSDEVLRLEIAATWDGKAIPEAERAQITLWIENAALILEVDAPAHGDPPPPGEPGPCDGLWDHEVMELFVAGPAAADGATPYTEIELSPHGHYLVLQLLGRRQVIRSKLPLAYTANLVSDGARWRGRARLDATLLPPLPHRLNAYAIHGQGVARRFLAWAPVFGASPDFHRLDAFIPMTLPAM